MNPKALAAEFFGTLWLVLGGCGAAVFAANRTITEGASDNALGLGYLGVALAFGLTVVTGAYAFGHVSGGHFNPAVTLGLVAGGRFSPASAGGYIVAQVLGGIAAMVIIWAILNGDASYAGDSTYAANGYGDLSPHGFNLAAGLIAEVVLTAMFLLVILGATAKAGSAAMGGLAIGLCLALIHFISIPITNTSVNPARSIAAALFSNDSGHLTQLWMFIVAPIVGGVLGGLIHRAMLGHEEDVVVAAA